MNEPRYVLKNVPGGRYAYIVDTVEGRTVQSLEVRNDRQWAAAIRRRDELNAQDTNPVPESRR